MNPHKRLFGLCARWWHEGKKVRVVGQTARLLRNLILFDHFTMRTVRLREFVGFVGDIGIDATVDLLKSGVLSISPDFALFGTGFKRSGDNARPMDRIDIGIVRSHRSVLGRYIDNLRSELNLPLSDCDRLTEAILSVLTPEPGVYGDEALAQARKEFISDAVVLRTAAALRLRKLYGFAISANDFNLAVFDEAKLYRFETNLATLCNLADHQVHDAIAMAMVAIAHMNVRLEEMRMYQSISGFSEQDLSLFEARIRFLVEQQNAEAQEDQFRRVVSLLNLPQVPTSGRLDFDKFLRLRSSAECTEFRAWLSESKEWSDQQIIERVSNLREMFRRYYQTTTGKAMRLLVSTGIGMVPIIGPVAGALISGLDTFLIDRVLKPSGAVTFISSSYPSLFEQ